MKILEYIHQSKERHYPDSSGGCYRFAKLLKEEFGGYIYSNIDHCILKLEGKYYDRGGIVTDLKRYIPIEDGEIERYEAMNGKQ